jgi:hypothetical protein
VSHDFSETTTAEVKLATHKFQLWQSVIFYECLLSPM